MPVFSFLKNISFSLTLYQTVQTFNDTKEEGFRKHRGKKRKCWLPAFSLFPTSLSTLLKREIVILTTIIMSSTNVSYLDQSKILLFCKELNMFHFYKN